MDKACAICGKTFTTNYQHQVYCSVACSEAKRRMHRPRAAHHGVCAWCHQPFVSVLASKWCSSECHQQYYRFRSLIFKKYQFDQQKSDSELKKLEQLGNDYVLEGD